MGIIKKIAIFTMFAAMGGAALAVFPVERAYAGTYDIKDGNVTISCNSSGQKVNGSPDGDTVIEINHTNPDDPSSYGITINTDTDCFARVKLNGVNIDKTSTGAAAVIITGGGNAIIEISGNNIIKSGEYHAGIEKNNSGSLEIYGTGSLNVTGGYRGAGIGGGKNNSVSNITITGGTITANGGNGGAGIGGGCFVLSGNGGNGTDITITGGTVTANGGADGAGIGGGSFGAGTKITITGGEVTATGLNTGAGIGGGMNNGGSIITITGGTVSVTGGSNGGAGIGGGDSGNGSTIEISGGTVTASGGVGGAGIGGGDRGGSCDHITISKEAIVMAAGGSGTAHNPNTGAAIGFGRRRDNSASGAEVDPDISRLYTTGFIKYYAAGTGVAAMNNPEVNPSKIVQGRIIPITFDPNGGHIDGSTDLTTITTNDEKIIVNYPAVFREGHVFIGWFTAVTGGDSVGDNYVFNARATLYAHWLENPVFESADIDAPPEMVKGQSYIIPVTFTFNRALTHTDYAYVGNNCSDTWEPSAYKSGDLPDEYNENTFTKRITFSIPSDAAGNLTIKAIFNSAVKDSKTIPIVDPAPPTYTITFDPNGGTVSSGSAATGTDGKLASLPTPEWEGHTFTGWFTEKDGGTEVTTSTVFSSNDTIYAHWKKDEPTPGPEPDPDPTPSPAPDPAMDNLPSEITSVTKGDYRITFAGKIPFPGKSKVTIKNFGENFTVSQGSVTYKVTKIKINKKNKLIQITGLENADKKIVKEVKKATKGADGLSFDYSPFYVKDTDKVDPKFRKDELKSVKIMINGKFYKAKNTEYEYDKEKKVITFKAPNLGGSYRVP